MAYSRRAAVERKARLYPHRIEFAGADAGAASRGTPTRLPLTEGEPPSRMPHFLDCIASGARPAHRLGPKDCGCCGLARASQSLKPAPTAKAEDPAPAYPGVINSFLAFIDPPCENRCGNADLAFRAISLPHTRIGRDCSLGQNVMAGPDVTIGDSCKIRTTCRSTKALRLEDGVFCGPSCVFTMSTTRAPKSSARMSFRPTLVKTRRDRSAPMRDRLRRTIGRIRFYRGGRRRDRRCAAPTR